MSKYYIAYGTETETLEDPDQLVLIGCPEEWADLDNDELVRRFHEDHASVDVQPLVGFQDIIESLRLILQSVGGIHPSNVNRVTTQVIDSLIDAVDNNS